MSRIIDQFGRKRCQKKRKDLDYKLLKEILQKYFVVHKRWTVKNSFITYVWYASDVLFWTVLYTTNFHLYKSERSGDAALLISNGHSRRVSPLKDPVQLLRAVRQLILQIPKFFDKTCFSNLTTWALSAPLTTVPFWFLTVCLKYSDMIRKKKWYMRSLHSILV